MQDAFFARRTNSADIAGYVENGMIEHGHLAPGMHVMTKPFLITALARRVGDFICDS